MCVMPSSTATGNIVAFLEPEILLNLSETMCSCHQSQQGISIVPNSSKQKITTTTTDFLHSKIYSLKIYPSTLSMRICNSLVVQCHEYTSYLSACSLWAHIGPAHILATWKLFFFFWAIIMDMPLMWHLNKTLHQMQGQKPIRSPCYCRCCTSLFFKI